MKTATQDVVLDLIEIKQAHPSDVALPSFVEESYEPETVEADEPAQHSFASLKPHEKRYYLFFYFLAFITSILVVQVSFQVFAFFTAK